MSQYIGIISENHVVTDGSDQHFPEGEAHCPADHSSDDCKCQVLGCIHEPDLSCPYTHSLHNTDLTEIILNRKTNGKLKYYERNYNETYTKYHYGEDYYGNGSSYYYKSNSSVSKPDDRPRDQLKRIGIETLGKAQEVLDDLRTEIATTEKHQVSIATYYQLVRTSVDKIDFEYGWKRGMLDGNIPIRYVGKDGYLICFPKPVPLDS